LNMPELMRRGNIHFIQGRDCIDRLGYLKHFSVLPLIQKRVA
jgi:hypothetical protein